MTLNRTSIWAATVVLLQAVTPAAHAALLAPINGAVSLTSSTYSATAPAKSVSLSAVRMGGTSGAYSVTYQTLSVSAQAGKEFTNSSGTLSWADGDPSTKTFTIPVNTTASAGTKSFFVRLTADSNTLLGSRTSATVNVGGTGAGSTGAAGYVGLTGSTYSVNTSAGSVTLTAQRVGGTQGVASVTYSTISQTAVAGQQFTNSSGTVTWAAGDDANKTFSIPVSKTAFSGTKYFWVRLAAGSGTQMGDHTSATVNITSTATMPVLSVSASPTTIAAGSAATLKWAATNANTCAASGGWTASNLAASGSQSVANITKNTTFTMNCSNAAGSASKSTMVLVQSTSTTPPTTPAAGAVSRPAYNTGDGFFVLNGKLYDPDGFEFRIRGVNRNHYDSSSEAGIAKSGANAARVFVMTQYGSTWAAQASIIQNQHIAHQQVGIPANASYTTCSGSTSTLNQAVSDWVNNAQYWTPLNRNMIVNIANEWGPSNSTVWRDAYISAIKTMRAAGFTGTLMIDSGQCGQDMNDLLNYATDVFNSDPQKNIVFSLHLYGLTPTASVAGNFAKLGALAQSAGMAFVIGEFGPGRNIGPSPTLTTPAQVITAAEANGLGWMAWAWDDNNLGNCQSSDGWFSMTYNCGQYTQDSDLTIFGKDVVLNPTYGLQALAKKPNW